MEELDKRIKRNKSIVSKVAIIFGILTIFGLIFISIRTNMNYEKRIKIEERKVDSLQYIYTNASDSLQRFSNYNVLYTSIMARDNATKQLKYQVGDVVYCKPDSVKSVITDIIIGGSKYDYYVRYKVKTSLDSIHEVIPEQIY